MADASPPAVRAEPALDASDASPTEAATKSGYIDVSDSTGQANPEISSDAVGGPQVSEAAPAADLPAADLPAADLGYATNVVSSRSSDSQKAVHMVTLQVESGKRDKYEEFQDAMGVLAEQFRGYLGRDVNYFPIDSGTFGVSILVTFETEADLLEFTSSKERDELIKKAEKSKMFRSSSVRKEKGSTTFAFSRMPAKAPKILPPPKWKLFLIIWFCVYTAVVAINETDMFLQLMKDGHLEYEPALIVNLFIIVTFILYAFNPFLMSLNYKGYGLGAWLKRDRIIFENPDPQVHKLFHLRVLLSFWVNLFNDGFDIFNPPPPPPPPSDLSQRTSRLEGSLQALRRKVHETRLQMDSGSSKIGFESDTPQLKSMESKLLQQKQEVLKQFEDDKEKPVAITIHHRVRWECVEDFRQWQLDIIKTMSEYKGYVSSRLIEPSESETSDDLLNMYSIIFKFDKLENLEQWMISSDRARHLTELQPLLAAPDEVSASRDRQLPDAFTDVFVKQGNGVPAKPPPKWKVVVLTVMALFLTLWPLSVCMPRHFARWELSNKYGAMAVTTGITVFVNMYASAPFLTNLFGHWLRVPRPAYVYQIQPWKTIELGFTGKWAQLFTGVITVAYFVACGLSAKDEPHA